MEDKVCLDINIIIKLYFNEDNSSIAKTFYQTLIEKNISFILPSYAKIEFLSVARKKESIEKVPTKQVDKAVELFFRDTSQFNEVSDHLLIQSYEIAKSINSPVIYDCIYLALAISFKMPFVTADLKFLEKAQKIYPQSYSLEEALALLK